MSIFNNSIKRISTIAALCILTLSSCGIYKYTPAKDNPTNADDRVTKNIEEGKGFRLSELGSKGGNGTFQFATSNPLWRAAIDKLDFAPLGNVDYAGGIIVTDWFNEGNSNDQVKITIRFLTNEVRSDAIDVIIHKKTCTLQNKCKINKIEGTLNSEIRFAILKKAAQLDKIDFNNAKKKRGKYKIPGSNDQKKKKIKK